MKVFQLITFKTYGLVVRADIHAIYNKKKITPVRINRYDIGLSHDLRRPLTAFRSDKQPGHYLLLTNPAYALKFR